MKTVPGVESVTMATGFPFEPVSVLNGPYPNDYEIEGRPIAKGAVKPHMAARVVSENYFETIRQPISKGRSLTAQDMQPKSVPAVIINDTMARRQFPEENPIGKRIIFDEGMGSETTATIVGVAGDVKEYGLGHGAEDEVYIAYRNFFVNRLIVRTALDPSSMRDQIRAAIREIDPLIAIDRVDTVARAEYDSMASPRVMTFLLAIFAGLAVVISCGGIAAVMALSVSQRTREIGVRIALGARPFSVMGMLLRQGLGLAILGTILGMAGALALTRILSAFLYGTSNTDPATFIAASLLFLIVSAIACWIPARLVISIDPVSALRQE